MRLFWVQLTFWGPAFARDFRIFSPHEHSNWFGLYGHYQAQHHKPQQVWLPLDQLQTPLKHPAQNFSFLHDNLICAFLSCDSSQWFSCSNHRTTWFPSKLCNVVTILIKRPTHFPMQIIWSTCSFSLCFVSDFLSHRSQAKVERLSSASSSFNSSPFTETSSPLPYKFTKN